MKNSVFMYMLRFPFKSVNSIKFPLTAALIWCDHICACFLFSGIFSVLSFIFVLLTLILHIYDFGHKELWEESFKNYTMYANSHSVILFLNCICTLIYFIKSSN